MKMTIVLAAMIIGLGFVGGKFFEYTMKVEAIYNAVPLEIERLKVERIEKIKHLEANLAQYQVFQVQNAEYSRSDFFKLSQLGQSGISFYADQIAATRKQIAAEKRAFREIETTVIARADSVANTITIW